MTNCCWICEGWIEYEFIYPEGIPEIMLDIPDTDPVFLLLKHENYQLVYMPPAGDKRKVSLMVPKMKIFFCFFVNEELKPHPDYEVINLCTEENIVETSKIRNSTSWKQSTNST